MAIEQRGPDSWRITVSAGTDARTGQRQRIRKTVRGDRQRAEREEMRVLLEVGDALPDEFSLTTTVANLLDAWLPNHVGIGEQTRYDYKLAIDKHIIPAIGHVPLHKVRVLTLDRFYRQLAADGLGPDRIRRCHAILRGAFKQALKWEWMARNPAVEASPPPAPIRDIDSLKPADYRNLVKTATDTLFLVAVAIHIAGDIGPRRAEICGLQWPDFDLDAGTVRVVRTVDVIPGVGEVVKTIKGNPKRRLEPKPLHGDTIDVLRLWDLATAEARSLNLNPKQWLFQAPKSGSFYRPDILGRHFRRIAADAGLAGAHMHQLRHYVVTQLRDAGIDMDVISRRVGHSRTSTTSDIYGDRVAKSAWSAAEAIGRINRG